MTRGTGHLPWGPTFRLGLSEPWQPDLKVGLYGWMLKYVF
jgi:hypothetical protein